MRRLRPALVLCCALFVSGCTSPAERACQAVQQQAEDSLGHQFGVATAAAALLLVGYLVIGRGGPLRGPRHALRAVAATGLSALVALLAGLLGYAGGMIYADHEHPCTDSFSLHGSGALLLLLLFVVAPLAVLTGVALSAVGIARSVYAGNRGSCVVALVVGGLPGALAILSLREHSNLYAWALLLAAAVTVTASLALLARPDDAEVDQPVTLPVPPTGFDSSSSSAPRPRPRPRP